MRLPRVDLQTARLTQDPVRRDLNGGTMTTLRAAVNHKDRQGEQTTAFFDIVTWDERTGNAWLRGLSKGDLITASGILKAKAYQTQGGEPAVSLTIAYPTVLKVAVIPTDNIQPAPTQTAPPDFGGFDDGVDSF